MNDEAVTALKTFSEMSLVPYNEILRLFVFEHDVDVTSSFWLIFYSQTNFDASGIDYCFECKKFTVHISSN